jgi:hypothetical protein
LMVNGKEEGGICYLLFDNSGKTLDSLH